MTNETKLTMHFVLDKIEHDDEWDTDIYRYRNLGTIHGADEYLLLPVGTVAEFGWPEAKKHLDVVITVPSEEEAEKRDNWLTHPEDW